MGYAGEKWWVESCGYGNIKPKGFIGFFPSQESNNYIHSIMINNLPLKFRNHSYVPKPYFLLYDLTTGDKVSLDQYEDKTAIYCDGIYYGESISPYLRFDTGIRSRYIYVRCGNSMATEPTWYYPHRAFEWKEIGPYRISGSIKEVKGISWLVIDKQLNEYIFNEYPGLDPSTYNFNNSIFLNKGDINKLIGKKDPGTYEYVITK